MALIEKKILSSTEIEPCDDTEDGSQLADDIQSHHRLHSRIELPISLMSRPPPLVTQASHSPSSAKEIIHLQYTGICGSLFRLESRLHSQNKILASGEAICNGEALVEEWRCFLYSALDLPIAHTFTKDTRHRGSRPALPIARHRQDYYYSLEMMMARFVFRWDILQITGNTECCVVAVLQGVLVRLLATTSHALRKVVQPQGWPGLNSPRHTRAECLPR